MNRALTITSLLMMVSWVAACGFEPSFGPPTGTPFAAASSATPAPTPGSIPTPIIAASIECAPSGFNPPGTLSCVEAVDAVLAALPTDHAAIPEASFVYRLPCPLTARCAAAIGRDTGFVILSSESRLELVRVSKAADGTITTAGPEPYTPPDLATGPTGKVGAWTATCVDVPTSDCTGIAGLFVNNLARNGRSILDQSGGNLLVASRAACPAMPTWVDGSSCWQAITDVPDRQICMVIARQTISSPFGFAQVGGDEISGRFGGPPAGYPLCV